MTQQPLGFFDLLGDDVANENLDVNTVYESHAAFSVEGLGQVEAETPPHSPQQHDRYAFHGCSSPPKAERHLNSSKYLHYVLDDLEVQVDSIMQDMDRPLCDSLDYSTEVASAYGPREKNAFSSKSRAHAQFDGCSSRIRSSFRDRKIFGETANSNTDIWDERSSIFIDNSLSEWVYDMSWDRWPRQLDGDNDEFLRHGDVELTDYAFEGTNLPRKWAPRKPAGEVNIFESPFLEKQKSGYGHHFLTSERPSYCSTRTKFDIRDATGQPEWSRFMTEDGKDNFSLFGDYSCSSTAGEATSNQLPHSAARSSRRHFCAFSGSDTCGEFDFSTLNHCEKSNDSQKQNSGPGKSRWMPSRWEPKSTQSLNYPLQDAPGQQRSSLFEEGNGSADMHLSLSSSCQSSEMKDSPFGSEPWTADTLSAFPVPRSCFESKSYLDMSKNGLISEKLAFCKPSSNKHLDEFETFSEVQFVPTKPELSLDSPRLRFEVRPPDSCLDASSHGEIPNLSAQESVSKDDQNRSESKQGNHKPHKENPVGPKGQATYVVNFEENGPQFKETKDGALETSSSVKISYKSESSVDEKRYQHDAEVPHPKWQKDVENSVPNPKGNTVTEKGRHREKKTHRDSSPQLMLEGYIVQLLRIKKLSEEASAVTP